jgi:prefoldin subunit 5
VPVVKEVKTSSISDQEKKTIQKRFSQIEKDIDKLEKVIQEKELQLADPDFFQSPEFANAVKVYETKKQELEKLTEEWEQLVGKLSLG